MSVDPGQSPPAISGMTSKIGDDIVQTELTHIWHPCSQMKDFETAALLKVVGANGSYIHLNDGRKLIDGISSWWCKSLGHQHPRLRAALIRQAEKFEQVIFANTTNDAIVELSRELASLCPELNKVMYASDGSSVVEMAMKMSIHARSITNSRRHQFISLENSYHGETVGALSASDLGLYRSAYASMLLPVKMLRGLPYVSGSDDPRWQNCEAQWHDIEQQLLPHAETATAILVEPVVQGAGGMMIYSPDLLRRLRAFATKHDIHLIVDEIMTGFGRTGKMLAIEHAGILPDFLCLGKGLTGGWLPMSAMLTRQSMYDLFYADYKEGKSFLHSHTFSGNPLAASIANEVIKVMREESICMHAEMLGKKMRVEMNSLALRTGKLTNVRSIGAIVAADLICDPSERYGFAVCQRAIREGVLLRPLGNTIYWLPPLNMSECDMMFMLQGTERALRV